MTTQPPEPKNELRFRGGWGMAFIPLVVFVATCIYFFVVLRTFDFYGLAAGAFIGLLVGAIFAKDYSGFWAAVYRGIGSPTSATVVAILFVIGMYSQLIKVTGLSEGIVWLASSAGIGGAGYVLFTFIATCVISSSTGSSIGAMFTAFPVFFAAGIPLGVSPLLLGGAIVSGAIFGDNLAPVSDTTIISASTQRFRRKVGSADIGGVVSSRARYALLAAAVSAVFYGIAGAMTAPTSVANAVGDPTGLWMLIPVVLMLVVALVSRNIFAAITAGLIVGVVVGLMSGNLAASDIVGTQDGAATGFLVAGVSGIIPTIAVALSVFGILGVLIAAGVLDRITDALLGSRLSGTPRGAEAAIAVGSSALTVAFSGINGAAMMTFGPVVDELGAKAGIHPYRRSNVMDCFTMGISCVVPFLSAYLFIAASLTAGYGIAPLSTTDLFLGAVYPLLLTVVMVIAVVTGWGRRYEGPEGMPVKSLSAADRAVLVEDLR
jgi:Na+/H+ antiporter NhaC